jgi:hypothetical protein
MIWETNNREFYDLFIHQLLLSGIYEKILALKTLEYYGIFLEI